MNRSVYPQRTRLRRSALVLALGACLMSGVAFAQSNSTGVIAGRTGEAAGAVVVVENVDTGQKRELAVDAEGRYRATSLPIGRYKVSLQRDGQVVESRENIEVQIGTTADVSFGARETQRLESVEVLASAAPAIDVKSVYAPVVLNSEQLQRLPIARDVRNAALLAPGVVPGDARLVDIRGGAVLSFGGSAASENMYNINGYNVTDPRTNTGFFQLPFEAVDQTQVLTGGYSAEFGRATGGVINVTTKRGSNEWHAGAAVYWRPEDLRANQRNTYYPRNGNTGKNPGTIYEYNNKDKFWETNIGAYVGGPIIQDRLFFYAAADFTERDGGMTPLNVARSSYSATSGWRDYTSKTPRWYGKLDWNITDNNLLEFTAVQDNNTETRQNYGINRDAMGIDETFILLNKGAAEERHRDNRLYLGKYTGYLTDDLTLTALYGKTDSPRETRFLSGDQTCPAIADQRSGRGTPIQGTCAGVNPATTVDIPGIGQDTKGWRIDLEYVLGAHDLRAGIDKQTLQSLEGTQYWAGRYYSYQWTDDPNAPINDALGVGAPGKNEYVAEIVTQIGGRRLRAETEALYIEDRWEVADNWLVSLGLRDEAFENYNGAGERYLKMDNQIAPRLGVSWDVRGDSSLKLFANAGRYHVGVPNRVAERGAGGSVNTTQYYTFTGIDPHSGVPTGLTPIGPLVSANNEFGIPRDPRNVSTRDLKPYYLDELMAGMEMQLTPSLNFGARATYRKTKSLIDDLSDSRAIIEEMIAQGKTIDEDYYSGHFQGLMYNPGSGIDFYDTLVEGGPLEHIVVGADKLGFPKPKRTYLALNFFLEHPFENGWYGKIDYTWSRSRGNSEGQLKSDLGQVDVSQSQDWDFPEFMVGADGPLPNDRKHMLKAFGYYQFNEEWLVNGNAVIQSGRPKNCLGRYFGGTNPSGYNPSSYFVCEGVLSPRGSKGRLPWTYQLALGVQYRPNLGDNHDLMFGLDVINLLNQQRTLSMNERRENASGGVVETYTVPLSYNEPRYVQVSVRYDF